MASEVETILNEIRERVRAEQNGAATVPAVRTEAEPLARPQPLTPNQDASLNRLSNHLAVTARAWDRLPPVITNRSGALSRLELSIKKMFRPLTRWFTWEQVNFNAATHHALIDTLEALRSHTEQLAALGAALEATRAAINIINAEATARTRKLEAVDRELQTLRGNLSALSAEFRGVTAELRSAGAELEPRLQTTEAALTRFNTMLAEFAAETRGGRDQLANQIDARAEENNVALAKIAADLADDLNGRIELLARDLHEEQRVCFKQ